jgi:hypothetical protein
VEFQLEEGQGFVRGGDFSLVGGSRGSLKRPGSDSLTSKSIFLLHYLEFQGGNMKKKAVKKLALAKETIKNLELNKLLQVQGGLCLTGAVPSCRFS